MPTYLVQLLRYSVLLGLIPVLAMGLISYYIAADDIEEKVKASNTQLLRQNQQQVDYMLKGLERSTLQLAKSPLIKQALEVNWTADHFQEIRELSLALTHLQTSVMTSEAYFINFEQEWIAGMDRFQDLSQFKDEAVIKKYASHSSSLFVDTAGSDPYLTMVQKVPLFPVNANPKGLIVVKILKKEITERLSRPSELGYQYIMDHQGNVILGSIPKESEEELYSKVNADVLNRMVMDQRQVETYSFRTQMGSQKYTVNYLDPSSYGWTYVSIASVEALTRQTQSIAWIMGGICTAIFVFFIVTAYIWGRRMYRPIHRLVEYSRQSEQSTDRLADHVKVNELRFIEDSLRRLSISRSELQQQLSSHMDHMSESLMLMLLSGRIQSEDFLKRSARCGFPKEWRSLSVMTIEMDALHLSKYDEHDREILLYAINNMVTEIVRPESRFAPVILDHLQVTLLTDSLSDDEAAGDTFEMTAARIKVQIEQYLQLQISIGLSRPFRDLSDSGQAYGEATAALRQRIVLGAGRIVRFTAAESTKLDRRAPYVKLREIEERMMYLFKNRDNEKLMEVLENYLDEITGNNVFQRDYYILLLNLVMRTIEVTQELDIPPMDSLIGEKLLKKLPKLNTKEEIKYWFETQLFMPLLASMNEQAERQQVRIASRILDMIHSRYDQDITLDSCAAELNYHPFYLSRVFKKDVGMPFSDYLTTYRMNKAKLLLESTDMLVSDIGHKLKYANTSAFIRTFRKSAGMTPGQYREHHTQNKLNLEE
ncbi:helix-turn-helix domain-containing protein [Neobacillus mesonae]|nr:helix-turn-helix domain-containing protein [Neobacillus mesonae]